MAHVGKEARLRGISFLSLVTSLLQLDVLALNDSTRHDTPYDDASKCKCEDQEDDPY